MGPIHFVYIGFVLFFLHLIFSNPKKAGNIPVIPFYISLYDSLRGVGKTGFYNNRLRPLMEKHGALYIWSAGRWTILVTRPSYLVQIFRNEQAITKSGFNKKVPYGVFAKLMGENITDTRGDLYKTFVSVMRPGIQRQFAIDSLVRKSKKLASLFLESQAAAPYGRGVFIDSFVQRWAVSIYGEYFLDIELNCLERADVRLEKIVGEFNNSVVPFGPIFTEFPFVERIAWLFPSRRKAYRLAGEITNLMVQHTEHLTEKPPSPENETKMIHQLQRARKENRISEFHYRSNLNMMFIAGNENARFTLISAMFELAQNLNLQHDLRQEVFSKLPKDYTANDLNELPLLTSIIYEALRMYPPLSQLINRLAVESFPLDDSTFIPSGTWVGWSAYGVQTDPNVWGPSAGKFDPSRWGSNMAEVNASFRLHQAKGNFIPFNGYTRRCLGSGFALVQLKVALVELVREVSWVTDPTYRYSTTGRALLGPSNCQLVFSKVEQETVDSLKA